MGTLTDTNILLRRTQPDHPSHLMAVASVGILLAEGESLFATVQNMAEFWNVITRPVVNNGLGLQRASALKQLEKLERFLTVLPDPPALYTEWKRLIVKHSVLGTKVHDARLVAAMNLHGIDRILTFNVEDFARYDIQAVHPSSILNEY